MCRTNFQLQESSLHGSSKKFFQKGVPNPLFSDYLSGGKFRTKTLEEKCGDKKVAKSQEKRIQNQFTGFCIKVLRNEAAKIHNEYEKLRDHEKSLEILSIAELSQIAVYNPIFMDESVFEAQGELVVVTGNLLAKAIANLPVRNRDVILLAYYFGMTDREISEAMNVARPIITKQRNKTLNKLREFLEEEGFEWEEV